MTNSRLNDNSGLISSSYSMIPLLFEEEGRISGVLAMQSKRETYPDLYVVNESSYGNYFNDYFSPLIERVSSRYNFDFQNEISYFYNKLLASQQPLGAKFEKVLFDNLWDLYEN